MSEFSRNMAFIIGINNYTNGISSLQNAVNDAKKLVEILREKHEYKVWVCLDEVATLNNLNKLLEKILPEQVSENDRLLFYFAGHGVALNGDDGPEGYLIPQDAKLGDVQTYLPMTKLQESLSKLPCRHFLGILDCCFAGAFRWSSNRDLLTTPEVIHKERYDRFITDPAWQVITSAASDQKALDAFALNSERGQRGTHSPFAAALIEALAGKADVYPPATNGKPPGDGVITATELYLYLRDAVEPATEGNRQRQTPGIWPLKKHDKGEYIFLSPGHPLNLPPAPPLDASKNPYRGLESYDEEHSELFFGRTELVEKLHNFVKTHPLTVVLGASGSGKSSLVKAGLIPELRQDNTEQWCILPLIRPGETPLQALNNALKNAQLPEVAAQNLQQSLAMSIDTWAKNHPNSKLLLFIDQSEEIITLCQNEDERKEFFQQILKAINVHRDRLRVVLSLRSDFEPQVRDAGLKFVDRTVNNLENTVLESRWYSGRFIIPAMTRGELRQAIEKPAETRVMYFQPYELVEQLINEVADMPGALPLLSFALSELYLKYLKRQRDSQNEGITIDRALTQEDYQDLGGVIQSLTKRADEEYETLVKENPAYTQIIRHVMLRMIALGGGELARRRVPLSELEYPPEKNSFVTAVIERFTKARLLVKGDDADGNPYVEPAHDALVRGWQKLLMWKQEEQESLVLQQRLTPAATEWDSIKNKDKEQPKGILDWADPILDWLDQRLLFPIENKLSKIPAQFSRLLRQPQNQQGQSREKPVQFLWNANPYLEVLDKELNSDDNWFNQVEAEFVQQSVWQRRRNVNLRRSIAIGVIVVSLSLTAWALSNLRQALIQQISAEKNSTETAFRANQLTLETLISSLRAGKSLKSLFLPGPFQPDQQWQNQVLITLQKAVYQVKELNPWQGPQGNICGIFLSQDDKVWIAVSTPVNIINDCHEGDISLWDSESQQVTKLPSGNFYNVSFSPDGSQLAIVGSNKTIRLCGLESKHCKDLPKVKVSSSSEIESVSFSRDGKSLALIISRLRDGSSWEKQRSAYLWNLQSREGLKKLPGYSETQGIPVEDMRFSSDGYHIVEVFKDHNNSSSKIPDILLSKIHFWDYLSERELGVTANNSKLLQANLSSHNNFKDVILSSDGNKMVTIPRIISPGVSKICSINFWDLSYIQANSTQKPSKTFTEACSANFNPYNNQLAIGGINGDISFYNSNSMHYYDSNSYSEQKLTEWKAHEGAVKNVKFSSDGKRLITIGEDGVIRLWNTQESQSSLPSLPIDKKIESISVSPNGQQIALTDSQGAASLWDVSHQTLTPLPRTEGSFTSVIFAPDGKHLAGANKDNTITIFDIYGKLVYPNKFKLPSGNLKNMIFSPDGKLFIIVEYDKYKYLTYYMVDFSNNSKPNEIRIGGYLSKGYKFMGYTFSRNAKFVAATPDIEDTRGSTSGKVNLKDLSLDNIINNISITKLTKLNADFMTDKVAFNIDGNLMAITQQKIGKPDGTVMLWDIYANQIVQNFKTYFKAYENKTFKDTELQTGAIKSLSLSTDGSTLAILGQDGKVMLWHTGLDELLMQGCQQARNYLATLDEKNSDRHLCDDVPPTAANPNN
ncbi:caspase family protein (plasmid) [Nostoc sp. UHCC 0926]|uniref:nSTAND1 domain-containing NTPase n=1 Tax=Nostoc sp. UHCC 0926 TaxID=3025190 RepID=UPI00235FBEFE|nr:caspase family protein [Nostoc sp. UHCC 0926]WDD36669.1 caspase family protein [Nostoc sp. UHCC 0926]